MSTNQEKDLVHSYGGQVCFFKMIKGVGISKATFGESFCFNAYSICTHNVWFFSIHELLFLRFGQHCSELIQTDLVVTGSITGSEDTISLLLAHVLHHLEEST